MSSFSNQPTMYSLTQAQYQQLMAFIQQADAVKQMLNEISVASIQPQNKPEYSFDYLIKEGDECIQENKFVQAANFWYCACQSLKTTSSISATKKRILREQFQKFCHNIPANVCQDLFNLLFDLQDIRWLLQLVAGVENFLSFFTTKSLSLAQTSNFARDNLQLYKNMVKTNETQAETIISENDQIKLFHNKLAIDRTNCKVQVNDILSSEVYAFMSKLYKSTYTSSISIQHFHHFQTMTDPQIDSILFVKEHYKIQQTQDNIKHLPKVDFIYNVYLEDCKNLSSVSLIFDNQVFHVWEIPSEVTKFVLPLQCVDKNECIHFEIDQAKQLIISSVIMMACFLFCEVCLKLNDGATGDLFCDIGEFSNSLKKEIHKLPGVMNLANKQICYRKETTDFGYPNTTISIIE